MIAATLLLMVAAPPADEVKSARQAFSSCLRAYTMKSAEAHTAPDAFKTDLDKQCQPEADKFKQAMLIADKRLSIPTKDTQASFASEVEYYHEQYVETFADVTAPAG